MIVFELDKEAKELFLIYLEYLEQMLEELNKHFNNPRSLWGKAFNWLLSTFPNIFMSLTKKYKYADLIKQVSNLRQSVELTSKINLDYGINLYYLLDFTNIKTLEADAYRDCTDKATFKKTKKLLNQIYVATKYFSY